MTITIGTKAPDFELNLVTTSGETRTVKLKDFAGQNLVLFFYPKDDTSGCTAEACQFRDQQPDFTATKTAIIGVSRDTVKSHNKFIDKYDLNFPLASDESGAVTEAFGVWVEKSMYGKKYMGIERTTVLIDGKGIVRQVWPKVKVPGHAEAVLAAIKGL
ncbi:MAG: thioredoxin-dependent thiol peroxidase [Candidatus Pacebacteria bacterium]|nr:thioredoxin-dependent thiol peroxidase [Candidatus Paceibacterota bacterium]